jgi:hypothetical protein
MIAYAAAKRNVKIKSPLPISIETSAMVGVPPFTKGPLERFDQVVGPSDGPETFRYALDLPPLLFDLLELALRADPRVASPVEIFV